MRILLAAFGSRGDVQPMVALGVRMRADGHDVVLGASETFAGLARQHGLEFQAVGRDIEAWARRHDLTRRPARLIAHAVDYLREDVELSFGQTHAAARGADLLVSGIHAAAPSVAEALELPYHTLLFCPQLIASSHHPPPSVPWFSLPRFCNRSLWWIWFRALDVALKDAINRGRRAWKLPPIESVAAYLSAARASVASDGLLGTLPPDSPAAVRQTGALALEVGEALDPGLERFLAAGEPPVYVGFGSMPDQDPRGTTRAVVEALEACGRRGVVVSGWAGLGGQGVPPSVRVVDSAAHAALLPRVAVAVHHGGAGTTAAAARAGVPQVVVPHCVDQYYWGRQVYERGLGSRPIPKRALNAARLAAAIRYVLSHPRIAVRAREIEAGLRRTDGVAELTRVLYEAASVRPGRKAAA